MQPNYSRFLYPPTAELFNVNGNKIKLQLNPSKSNPNASITVTKYTTCAHNEVPWGLSDGDARRKDLETEMPWARPECLALMSAQKRTMRAGAITPGMMI